MQQVNLNLVPGGVNPIVYASQNDDKRTIRFELVSGGDNDVYVLSGNETITAKITKPDGTAITIPITNPGSGKHYVDLVNGVSDYDQDGVYLGEVSITKGEKVLGTGNFVLKVEADPYDGSVQKKIVIDNPATFSTSLPDVLVSCKCKIDDANGIDSMDVINAGPTYARDSVPYQLRQTPITANRTLEKLIGVSCAFNQLVQNGNFADTSNWTTLNSSETSISASNNELTVTLLVIKNTWYGNSVRQFLNTVANHVYFITNTIEVSKQSSVCVAYNTSGLHITKVVNSGVNVVYNIFKSDDNGTDIYFGVTNASDYNYAIGDTYKLSNCMLIDLTTCFGSEVADYLYNLENN